VRGAELYQSLGCFNCHGAKGRGDGPSAAELKDDWGNKIVPYDFSSGGRLKCGDQPADLYRVFMTGLSGTPMPSFADSLSPQDAWNLVHYLRSLSSGQ
jgi:mono/diheme cytochrome c family protein